MDGAQSVCLAYYVAVDLLVNRWIDEVGAQNVMRAPAVTNHDYCDLYDRGVLF